MSKISVVISAFNEEKKIEDCLKSVAFADEVILVDNESTDRTADIAKKYTIKIYTRKNNPMLNINKNFGFTKAANEWILNLDADERVTPELKEEIIKTLKEDQSNIGYWKLEIGNSHVNGYYIPRKNIIFGKWIKHAGWYPDYQLRLFRKGIGKFEEKHVHELIKLDGKVGYLKENLVHYNFETIFQFLNKHINIYAHNEAGQLLEKGYQFDWRDVIRFPVKEFLSRFFAREGYKEGFHGLIISMLMAFYHLVILAIVWEKQGFKNIEIKNILDETEKEFKNSHKEMKYWFFNESLKTTKNPVRKMTNKILHKLMS